MDVDAFNRLTFALLRARQEELFAAVPWIKARVEEVADHLENHDVRMPTGSGFPPHASAWSGCCWGRRATSVPWPP
ncbi:hypothetical protein [Corynebacterium aquatimens]|uniref:hypothetical protein n=1 Tax=Corynebacterium aquatimens TaxID=1190508 RepID=UPI0025403DA0|nr:hypothetical protein [Corynebacterium aquatimens]